MSKSAGLQPRTIIVAPDFVQNVVLSTGSSNAQAFDVPSGMEHVVFSFNNDVWVKYGSTQAAIPTSSSTLGSSALSSELNPTARNIGSTLSCTGISIASEYATKGSIAWYKPG